MDKQNQKGWLYLLPAILFLGIFMVYPLVDVLIYSLEEGYNSASQAFFGVGLYNFNYVLHDPYFLQAIKNTFILVAITVPVSTGLALLISVGLSSIKKLRNLYQTIYFLPYVTNTLAVVANTPSGTIDTTMTIAKNIAKTRCACTCSTIRLIVCTLLDYFICFIVFPVHYAVYCE